MVARGTRVNHATVAIAAAVGRAEIAAYRRPRVAILATGDELVDINLPPGPNEIRNSNSYSLAAQVYAAGGEPVILPVAPDRADELALLLRKGFEADLLLISGGVSMGKYDLVEQVLASFDARFLFTGVRIQPGKPVVFGEVALHGRTVPFFGLPGNPVSTMVTFQLFARPVLDALAGSKPQPLPFAQASLKAEFTTKTGLTRFLPAKLGGTHERPEVELVRWQGSGDLMAVVALELLHCGTTGSRAVRRRRSDDGPAVLNSSDGKAERQVEEALALRCRRTRLDGGCLGQTAHGARSRGARLRGDEPRGHARSAAKSQGRSARGRPRGRHHGRQAYGGAHPHVSSGSAEQGRRCHRGAGKTELPFARSLAPPPSPESRWKPWSQRRLPRLRFTTCARRWTRASRFARSCWCESRAERAATTAAISPSSRGSLMKLSGLVAIMLWSLLGTGQEVHVSTGKGSVVLSVRAAKPYQLISGEAKMPVLAIECAQKGKKAVHLLKFQAGGSLAEDGPEGNPDTPTKDGAVTFPMTIGGERQLTTWIPYGDTITYAYYGKTEPERVKFIQFLLGSPTVSIEFKPFLTGAPTTSVFDISKLRAEMDQHSECAMK